MKINTEKTKTMTIGKGHVGKKIRVNGEELGEVKVLKYLGVKIHKNGKNDAEIKERIENTTKLYYKIANAFIRTKEVFTETKITVYNRIEFWLWR
nr:unnamed protein product [Callosobruchus analis]